MTTRIYTVRAVKDPPVDSVERLSEWFASHREEP